VLAGGVLEEAAAAICDTVDPKGSIEVALLIRRTGTILGAWTKGDIPREIVSVMAATMLGSIETMSEALGCPSPDRAMIETESCRMLAEKFEPQGVLILVASNEMPAEALQRVSRQMLQRLSEDSGSAQKIRPAVPARP